MVQLDRHQRGINFCLLTFRLTTNKAVFNVLKSFNSLLHKKFFLCKPRMCGIRHWYSMAVNMFLWHPASAGNRFLRRFCVCSQKFKNDEKRMPSVYFFASFVISWWDLHRYICFTADYVTVCFFLLSQGYCFITYTEFNFVNFSSFVLRQGENASMWQT